MEAQLDSSEVQAVAACLDRTQRLLLAAGYEYADGDLQSWPLSPVLMAREGGLVLVASLLPAPAPAMAAAEAQAAALRERGAELRGVILVGCTGVEDAAVEAFLQRTGASVACLNAVAGTFRCRRSSPVLSPAPKALRDASLRKCLDPAADRKHRGIDCRRRLADALSEMREVRQFHVEIAEARGANKPYGTYALLAACIGVFALMAVSGVHVLSPSIPKLLAWGASYGPRIKAGQWWRLITCMFLHIGLVHLLFNMYAAKVFGPPLERFQGTWRMLVYFLFGGLAGSVTSLWWSPVVVGAGASGGLFGMVGGMAAIYARHWRDLPVIMRRGLRQWLLTLLIYNAVFLVVPGIDAAAHVGGLVGGLLMGLALARSPRRDRLPGPVGLAAAAVLIAAVVLFAVYAIRRVPI